MGDRRGWIVWLLFALLPVVSGAAYRQTRESGSSSADIVILVDESGSLSEADVDAERQAAALMALSDLSETSTYTIIGFGSENGPGQIAARVYCERLPIVDAQARRAVADCANGIHRRERAEGNDTDHATALQDAIALLGDGDSDATRIVFLLTDGVLDVQNSARWGPSPTDRSGEARKALTERILPEARRLGVQIWPLGFGNADSGALEAIADGGAGPNAQCDTVEAAVPTARVVSNQRDVINALNEALAGATCANLTDPVSGLIRGGETLRLKVRIPVIATEGSITVTKVDPRVEVAYVDPDGKDVPLPSGTLDDQDVERVGSDLAVEALRVSNPKPGEWTVVLTAPDGLSEQLVDARVLFKGRLSSTITMVPSFPRPGDQVEITVRLSTRRGVISDPDALKGIQFSASAEGEGFGPEPIDLTPPQPGSPDASAYTGSLLVPTEACGSFVVTGRVTGRGVSGDVRSANSAVNCDAPIFANLIVEGGSHRPGDTIGVRIEVENEGSATEARLSLRDVTDGVNLIVEDSPVTISSGTTTTERSVTIGEETEPGEIAATLRLVTPEGVELASAFVQFDIVGPPSWWDRNGKSAMAGFILLLALLLALVYWRRRLSRIHSLSDLTVQLYDDEGPSGERIRGSRKSHLELAVEPIASGGFEIMNVVPSSEDVLRIRRPRAGVLDLQWRRDEFEQLLSQPLPLGQGWRIVFRSTGGPGAKPGRKDLKLLGDRATRERPAARASTESREAEPSYEQSAPAPAEPSAPGSQVQSDEGPLSNGWEPDVSDNPWE